MQLDVFLLLLVSVAAKQRLNTFKTRLRLEIKIKTCVFVSSSSNSLTSSSLPLVYSLCVVFVTHQETKLSPSGLFKPLRAFSQISVSY